MLHILILITLCSTSLNAMRMPEYEKQSVTQNPLITLTAQLIKKDTAGNYSHSSSTFNINRNGDCNALELGNRPIHCTPKPSCIHKKIRCNFFYTAIYTAG